MDLEYGQRYEDFRRGVRAFLDQHKPKDSPGEISGIRRKKLVEWLSLQIDEGYWARTIPKEFGGYGAEPNLLETVIMDEEFNRAGVPRGMASQGASMLVPTLLEHGTDEQRQRWIGPTMRGEVIWCQGYSEPGSGSDLASLQTSAKEDGDDFIINGQKIWTSFGDEADYCYLICRTDASGPPHRGISEIIVPMDTPGIEVRPITDMTTNRHFCEVYFTDARVPAVNLVGVEGNAFKQTMVQLEHERGGIDRLVSNKALYDLALERADTSDPRVRQEIAALEIGYRLGRILVTREVLRQAPTGFSAATKCFCTEHEIKVADFVAKTFGADALLWSDVTKGFTYGPGYTIMGGTSNIMRNILGERVLGLPREPR